MNRLICFSLIVLGVAVCAQSISHDGHSDGKRHSFSRDDMALRFGKRQNSGTSNKREAYYNSNDMALRFGKRDYDQTEDFGNHKREAWSDHRALRFGKRGTIDHGHDNMAQDRHRRNYAQDDGTMLRFGRSS